MEAARWYRAAASNGVAVAALHLGYMAVNGQMTDGDLALTVEKIRRRAAGGEPFAQHQLGNLHLTGLGTPRNNTEAVRLITRAAEGGVRDAMYQLGIIHHTGTLVPKDLGEAARWLRLAAQDGHVLASRQMEVLFGQKVTGTNGAAARQATATGSTVATRNARLALVPLVEALRPMSDLLTASFSALPQVTLLERAEIERVIREQSLAATLGRDPLKLGQLLGADGVLLLETNSVGEGVMTGARLVAVGPGVVLGEWLTPFPVADTSGWSARVTADAMPQLRKLAVPRAQATPISVLGLRMVVNAPDAGALQQGLSRVLAHRLTQEPELFVLERQRLDRLDVEKELAGTGETPFWSGSHLLDGTIEPDLATQGMLNVRLQLASPGNVPVTLTDSGARTNLAALANSLAGKVLAALRKTSTVIWQPEAEAQHFWDEAMWERRWGQWRAAAAAMESAWALGLRGSNHAAFRLESLLGSVEANRLRWLGTRDFPEVLRQPPDPANLDYTERALEAFRSYSRGRGATELAGHRGWLALGTATLEVAGRTLAEFYHAPEQRRGMEEKLARLRALTRETLAFLQTQPALGGLDKGWESLDRAFREKVLGPGSYVTDLDVLQASCARYWVERPEETLALHLRMMQRPDFLRWRRLFVSAQPTPLAAWNSAERPGLHTLWAAHLRSLAESTNAARKFEIQLASMETDENPPWPMTEPKLTQAIRQFLDFAWTHREALTLHQAGPHSASSVLAACRNRLAFYHEPTGREDAKRRLEAVVADYEKRFRDFQAAASVAAAPAYLREAEKHDPVKFDELIALPNFTAAQARELLPLAQAYSARILEQPGFFQQSSLTAGLRRLRELAATNSQSSGPTPAAVSVTQPSKPSPAAVTRGSPSPDALRVTRFWLAPELRRPVQSFVGFPLPPDHRVNRRLVEVQDWAWREGRLWLAWRHQASVYLGRGGGGSWMQECSHVAGYSLPTLEGDLKPEALPEEARSISPLELALPGKFEVLDDRVYVSGTNGVWRMDKPRWEKLPVELSGSPSLFVVHGRIIISAPDVLYAYDPKSGRTELLASARRRPAANAADGLVAGMVQAGPIPNERMRMITAGCGVIDYDFNTRKWGERLPVGGHAGTWLPDAVAISYQISDLSLLHVLPHTATNSQFAAFRLPKISMHHPEARPPGVPLWQPSDQTLSPPELAITSMSNLVWSVTIPNFHRGATNTDTFLLATNGHHVRLAAWRRDLKQPAVVPLWFEAPPDSINRSAIGSRRYSLFTLPGDARGGLLATPPGLVYRHEAVSGFWFIPWSDVLPRVEAQFSQLAAARDARPKPPGNSRLKRWLYDYDVDGDGKLSAAEFAVLQAGEKLSITGGFMFQSSFSHMDRNRNGLIDEAELAGYERTLGRSSTIGSRVPGGADSGAMPSFKSLMSGPPPPEILQRYDKNKNGKMDPEEMLELIRDRQRGAGPRPSAANSPSSGQVPQPSKK
ncbi:MAG: hypothetical protein WCS99_16320 [Limisphaerales bacterium]